MPSQQRNFGYLQHGPAARQADGHTGRDIAKFLGVSRATLYRYLDDSPASVA
ncbi:MAG: helix-turn-helix domain-containing protein [Mycobacterium sp.]|uniref:helix-turn-helix domain-containing protein n=1 Tax=Mycobacterium sp. TaxID=1785 RepID=UPI003F9DA904